MSEGMSTKRMRCCVGNCTSVGSCRTFNKQTGLILFRFPSATRPCTIPETREKWIDFVREKRPDYKPHNDSYVCSDHFTFDCLAIGPVLKMQFGMKAKPFLKRDAFPTINKESVETDSEPDKACMNESTALTTNTRSRAKMLKEKNASKSFKSNFQTRKAKAAKTKSSTSLVSKSAKMTSLKSKYTTPDTPKSKRKTPFPKERSTKSGKRSKKTQEENCRKKRKLSKKPEIVVERWGEDDEEDGLKDGGGSSPDKGESPTNKRGGPPAPKVSKSVKETKNSAPKRTEPEPEGDFLKEFFKTQIDPTKTDDFIRLQTKSNYISNYPAKTNSKESDTLKVNANPRMPHKTSCKVPEGKKKDPKIVENNAKGPEKPTGTNLESTVATTSKITYPEKASNNLNVNLKKVMNYSEASDNYLELERHIKQETEVAGSLNIEPVRGVLSKESNSPNSNGEMLLELAKSRSEMEYVDLQVKNRSLHHDSLDAACSTNVDLEGKEHGSLLGHFIGPSGSTDFDDEESAFQDQDLRLPGDASEGPGEMFFDITDKCDADSDVALAVDEEENMIFCCSTCGDVQPVEGESRVVICNDMTMKMTNTLCSKFMSVFCKKCSTESETCFQCNEHIERGNFKEHLKLHFG